MILVVVADNSKKLFGRGRDAAKKIYRGDGRQFLPCRSKETGRFYVLRRKIQKDFSA